MRWIKKSVPSSLKYSQNRKTLCGVYHYHSFCCHGKVVYHCLDSFCYLWYITLSLTGFVLARCQCIIMAFFFLLQESSPVRLNLISSLPNVTPRSGISFRHSRRFTRTNLGDEKNSPFQGNSGIFYLLAWFCTDNQKV